MSNKKPTAKPKTAQLKQGDSHDAESQPKGRPSLISPAITKAIANYVTLGLSSNAACTIAGISYQTYRNWYIKGRKVYKRVHKARTEDSSAQPTDQERDFFDFFVAIKKATPKREAKHLKTIYDAANKGDWFAAAWMLQRLHPEKYILRVQQQHTGKDGGDLPKSDPVIIYLPDNGRGDSSAPTAPKPETKT